MMRRSKTEAGAMGDTSASTKRVSVHSPGDKVVARQWRSSTGNMNTNGCPKISFKTDQAVNQVGQTPKSEPVRKSQQRSPANRVPQASQAESTARRAVAGPPASLQAESKRVTAEPTVRRAPANPPNYPQTPERSASAREVQRKNPSAQSILTPPAHRIRTIGHVRTSANCEQQGKIPGSGIQRTLRVGRKSVTRAADACDEERKVVVDDSARINVQVPASPASTSAPQTVPANTPLGNACAATPGFAFEDISRALEQIQASQAPDAAIEAMHPTSSNVDVLAKEQVRCSSPKRPETDSLLVDKSSALAKNSCAVGCWKMFAFSFTCFMKRSV